MVRPEKVQTIVYLKKERKFSAVIPNLILLERTLKVALDNIILHSYSRFFSTRLTVNVRPRAHSPLHNSAHSPGALIVIVASFINVPSH